MSLVILPTAVSIPPGFTRQRDTVKVWGTPATYRKFRFRLGSPGKETVVVDRHFALGTGVSIPPGFTRQRDDIPYNSSVYWHHVSIPPGFTRQRDPVIFSHSLFSAYALFCERRDPE